MMAILATLVGHFIIKYAAIPLFYSSGDAHDAMMQYAVEVLIRRTKIAHRRTKALHNSL
jgi:hypothetical protein